ncbi:hypothetical protein BDY19DRAFT_408344 [Irpex rosettiformis]|uniref:Uncharacterized protein n=1 Tax=Irpex rosettiformis TaxID=378272 RepID=A0ACB8UFR7_9APHY|nr:hypothetical protein BDY19DRAFT_408344 [Irpex rosettiformis]
MSWFEGGYPGCTRHGEVKSDVGVNIVNVSHPIYHGCKNLEEAHAIFKRHQDAGTLFATIPEGEKPMLKQQDTDIPVFYSAARAPAGVSGTSATANTQANRMNRKARVESEDEDDAERTRVERAVPSDPITPSRGGSRQGTPARGRARAASPTPTPQANHTQTRRQATPRTQARAQNTNNARTADESPERAPAPSSSALRHRNIMIKNLFLTKTVNISSSRSPSFADGAQAASHARHTARSASPVEVCPSSSSEDEEDEDAGFFSPLTRQTSVSSPNSEIEGDSEPEAISEVSVAPSPRRPRATAEQELGAENVDAARRCQTPPSRSGSASATAVGSKCRQENGTGHTKNSGKSKASPPQRAQTGEGLNIDTSFKRTKLSSSPPTCQTQHEDGISPFSWLRSTEPSKGLDATTSIGGSTVPLPDPDFSITAALRARRSRTHASSASTYASDIDDGIIPTRPNTPPPPPPTTAVRERISSHRSHRPTIIPMRVCRACMQPFPNPPLPPPMSRSKGGSQDSIGTSSSRSSIKVCKHCYQPLPRSTSGSGSGSLSRSGSDSMATAAEYIEVDQVPLPPPVRGSSSQSSRSSRHSRAESVPMQRNALGLTGADSRSSAVPSSLKFSGVSDPRSPTKRSDTLPEIGSPRSQILSFRSLSNIP